MNFKKLFQFSALALSLLAVSPFITANTAHAASNSTSQTKAKKGAKKKKKSKKTAKKTSRRERIYIGKWEQPSPPDLRSKFIQETDVGVLANKKISVRLDTTGYDESFAYNALHANAISINYELFSF